MSYTRVTLATLLVLFTACGGENGSPDSGGGGEDAGLRDAGTDAGSPQDAGRDAGGGEDAGRGEDAGGMDGGTGSILPPVDGGDPFGDAGPPGDPPWVDLVVHTDDATCGPVVACGGDVLGTWDVSGGCFELPIEDALSDCPGAMVTRRYGRARGRVVFDAVLAHRVAQGEVSVQVFVPGFCAGFLGGCSGLETMIMSMAEDSVCITEASGDCRCEARLLTSIDDTEAYTIDMTSNEIVGVTSGKRWAYCISGSTLRYEDTSPSGPREPGIIELTQR